MAKTELLNEKQLNLVKKTEKLENAEAKMMELVHKNHLLVNDKKSR